jgi:hypothetical protein
MFDKNIEIDKRGEIYVNIFYIFLVPSQICEKRLLVLSRLSVCLSAWKNSDTTGRFFMKFTFCVFFEKLSRKFKFHSTLTRISGTLREDRYAFVVISHSFLLIMVNVSEECCRDNQNTHLYSITSFQK